MTPLHPAHGGRLELKLVEKSEGSVRYALDVSVKERSWAGQARIALPEGAIEFDAPLRDSPDWLLEVARALLRTLYRSHREDAAWPRRLTRWRPEPDASRTRRQ